MNEKDSCNVKIITITCTSLTMWLMRVNRIKVIIISDDN